MGMKEMALIFAQYNQETNDTVCALLDALSPEEREKDRGSYYGSLSGLARHLVGGTIYFQGMFKEALRHNSAAIKALAPLESFNLPEALTDAQWNTVRTMCQTADAALVALVSALTEEDCNVPIALSWYSGKPATVPLYFMLHQVMAHGTHHRGQISQILDELKIDHDYAGINVAFLPKV